MISPQIDNMLYSASVLKKQIYKVYQVFELPNLPLACDIGFKSNSTVSFFLNGCIDNVLTRNQFNVDNRASRSGEYFTNLNNKERLRIPLLLRRMNAGLQEQYFGLMSFVVAKNEKVKNKIANQRISSINPDILTLERAVEIIYPQNYDLEQYISIEEIGQVTQITQEKFSILKLL